MGVIIFASSHHGDLHDNQLGGCKTLKFFAVKSEGQWAFGRLERARWGLHGDMEKAVGVDMWYAFT